MNRTPAVWSALNVAIIGALSCERVTNYPEPPASSYTVDRFTLAAEQTDTLRGAMVSPEFFSASNMRPLIGRTFVEAEHESAAVPVAVISEDLWRRRFKAAPQFIGATVQLNGRAVTVVGVAPERFEWPKGAAVWVPRLAR